MQAKLHCYPGTSNPAIHALFASAERSSDGTLRFSFDLTGHMADILIPVTPVTTPSITPERADGLWRHTCFEAFISAYGDDAYYEFNFSPGQQWAAYAFSAYRQAESPTMQLTPPEMRVRISADRLQLAATLMPDTLPKAIHAAVLDIGLSAVIETTGNHPDRHSYWALHHPTERPDFHDRRSFVLQIPTLPITAPITTPIPEKTLQ